MSFLSLIALSLATSSAAELPTSGYSCFNADGKSQACAASPMQVANGKGFVPGAAQRVQRSAQASAACHSDPGKGRACRHHKLQAERADAAAPVLAARDDLR